MKTYLTLDFITTFSLRLFTVKTIFQFCLLSDDDYCAICVTVQFQSNAEDFNINNVKMFLS